MNSSTTVARFFAIFTGVALFAAACAGLGAFSFSEESEEIVVQASPLPDLLPAQIPMEVNLEEQLAAQDASGARSVYLRELYFETTENSDDPHFDFLDRITISVASRQSGSNLSQQQLAWSDPVPDGQERFYLDIDDDLDLKPYAEEGLRLTTNASGSTPSQEVRFKVYARFRVNVL